MTRCTVALLALLMSTALYAARGTQSPSDLSFAGDQIRVHSVSIARGGRAELRAHADALIVPFGTDLDGRAPLEAVTWRPAGTTTLENRGANPFDALIVELVASPSEGPPSLLAELSAPTIQSSVMYPRAEGHRVRPVFDNQRVNVSAHRLPDWQPATEPWHWHSRDLVLVYLAGGDIAGSTGQIDARRVRRGEFDVLPANVPHTFQNVGNSPLEFLLIAPK